MSVWRQLPGTLRSTQNSGFRLFPVKKTTSWGITKFSKTFFLELFVPFDFHAGISGFFDRMALAFGNSIISRFSGTYLWKFPHRFQVIPVSKISGFLFDGGDELGFNGKCSGFSGHFPRKGTWALKLVIIIIPRKLRKHIAFVRSPSPGACNFHTASVKRRFHK